MVYALVSLAAALVLGSEWYLLSKYREARDALSVASAAGNAVVSALRTANADLMAAREALARQNDLEAKTDARTVAGNPGLADAVARFNGL